jgi:hypothetical protein
MPKRRRTASPTDSTGLPTLSDDSRKAIGRLAGLGCDPYVLTIWISLAHQIPYGRKPMDRRRVPRRSDSSESFIQIS